MRRTAVQPKIRSLVSVLQSPVTPFDRGKTIAKSANFTKNANCFEECNVFWQRKVWTQCHLRLIGETKVQILARKSAKLFANFSVLAGKSANFFANFKFSATKVTSLPSLSLSLSLSLYYRKATKVVGLRAVWFFELSETPSQKAARLSTIEILTHCAPP